MEADRASVEGRDSDREDLEDLDQEDREASGQEDREASVHAASVPVDPDDFAVEDPDSLIMMDSDRVDASDRLRDH